MYYLNSFSSGTNVVRTNFPVSLNISPNAYQTLFMNGITGTNVIIGTGFGNTANTGVETWWLGDNNGVLAPGSLSLGVWLEQGTNILHQFASVAQPDVIIYHAKDFYDYGSTNIQDMTNSLYRLLGNTGLSWTNTKVFVIATPGTVYPYNANTTNNTAIRLACEANNWSYIPLAEDYSSQLYGTSIATAIGADPYSAGTISGIIGDGTHPSDWGSYVMANWILKDQLRVPLKFDPSVNNVQMSYQTCPPQFCAPDWGVSRASIDLAADVFSRRSAVRHCWRNN